jgi:biopolymer transport protein TolR
MRQRKLVNQINVVPYIDVMLVLLVIFMVTAPLVTPSVVNLPSVGKSTQAPEAAIELYIKADGAMLVRERGAKGAVEERSLSSREFVGYVKSRLAGSATPVVIGGDKDVRYEAILKVMDELQRANVRRVGLLVKPEAR